MPLFFSSLSSAPIPEPTVEVYIDGNRMRSVLVSRVVESSGIEPGAATLLFPSRDYLAHPCADNARVMIYINRLAHPDPVFRGYVTGFGDFLTLKSGAYVEVHCLDDVVVLQRGVCSRNYNITDTRDNYSERLTIRQIIQDIDQQASDAFGSAAPQLMATSFPNDFPGEVTVLSQPFNTAIATVLELAGEYKWNIRRKYTDTQTLIYAYRTGTGEVAVINYGTDPDAGPRRQPHGVVNAGEIRREDSYTDVVNKAVVIGDRKTIETALALSAAWNRDKDGYLSNLQAYTEEGAEDEPNPDYDPEAERVGRAWRYGVVNTGRFTEYPEMEPRLLASPTWAYTGATSDYAKPFVVYRFGSEATYNVTFDFQLRDNEIMTEKPLVRGNATGGGTLTPTLPSAVYFNCAYRMRTPLAVETSKRGSANATVIRHFPKPQYKYQYRQASFTLALVPGAGNATLGVTTDSIVATYAAGPTVVRDDSAEAMTWAIARLQSMQDIRREVTYTLPRMDMTYAVGQTVKENGQFIDCAIDSVEYEVKTGVTIVSAVSR